MTIHSKTTFTFPVCVLLIVLYSSPGLSGLKLVQKQDNAIVIENQPFTLQCSVTGTEEELKGKKIIWFGQDQDDENHLNPITGEDDSGKITTEPSAEKITSILNVPKLPNVTFLPNYLQYKCEVDETSLQFAFQMRLVREEAVPQIAPFQAKIVKAETKAILSCTISYHNKNFQIEYKLNLYWIRDGRALRNKSCVYKPGNRTCQVTATVAIKSSKDGGNYTCEWKLADDHDSILGRRIQTIKISAFRSGPAEKEVKGSAGSDVKLHCDLIGFPITYEWKYEDGTKIVDNNRIKVKDNVVTIDDVDYDDRKKYFCYGIVNGTKIQQVIILRVKDPLATLWPFLGILAEAIVVAAIIILTERFKSEKGTETDSGDLKTEVTEPLQPSTSYT